MTINKMRLDLFGEGGGDGGNAGAAPAGNTGETVVYGKQEAAGTPAAAENTDPVEEKRKAFLDMVKGEYKDIYTQETQKIIDRRFKETKNLESRLASTQPTIDMLLQRYNITDGDLSKLQAAVENDDVYWENAADEAGMTTEQYKKFQKMQRENANLLRAQKEREGQAAAEAQVQKWQAEERDVQATYPDFNLQAEIQNPDFARLITAGIPVRHAYEVTHLDAIKSTVKATTAAQTEKAVTDNIRARGMRPKENGTAAQAAFTVKDDVTKLTRQDREDIARRVAMGEMIRF